MIDLNLLFTVIYIKIGFLNLIQFKLTVYVYLSTPYAHEEFAFDIGAL